MTENESAQQDLLLAKKLNKYYHGQQVLYNSQHSEPPQRNKILSMPSGQGNDYNNYSAAYN